MYAPLFTAYQTSDLFLHHNSSNIKHTASSQSYTPELDPMMPDIDATHLAGLPVAEAQAVPVCLIPVSGSGSEHVVTVSSLTG